MNQIAKLVSGRLKAQAAGPHPDANMLSAFAEKALPEKDRAQLLQHLGTCADCRGVLYLAAPESSGQQEGAPSFQRKPQSRFLLRWATAGACVAILATAFLARHQVSTGRYQAAKSVPTAESSTYPKISEAKSPPELDKMRNEVAPNAQRPAVASGRPEAKHMTARLQAPLDFGKSDEVRLSSAPAPSSANRSADSTGLSVPLDARNLSPLAAAPAASRAKALAPQQSTEELALAHNELDHNELAHNENDKDGRHFAGVSGAQDGLGSDAKGNLVGTIADPSGAVIANARVTTAGPGGIRIASSNPDGTFFFSRLAPGSYSVKAEASGFRATEFKQVAVLDDKALRLHVTLEPGTASETVAVSAASPAAVVTGGSAQATIARDYSQMSEVRAMKKGSGAGQGVAGKDNVIAEFPSQWTLSPSGSVQRSTDAGKTWQTVSPVSGTGFRALSAIGTHVWTGGSGGMIFHSDDSGRTWVRIGVVSDGQKLTGDINHIDFSDTLNGTVGTANGETWLTANGGQTWRRSR